jgi:hypothetical protein
MGLCGDVEEFLENFQESSTLSKTNKGNRVETHYLGSK